MVLDWVYSVQRQEGFMGSTFLKSNRSNPDDLNNSVHIAMTYTALAILVILGEIIFVTMLFYINRRTESHKAIGKKLRKC